MNMFWQKCGKILTKNGKVIHCQDCPCGYWALFVFKVRAYDMHTGDILNECSWGFDIQPMEVIDGKINYNGYGGNRCIEITRQPGVEGNVGYIKSCIGCGQDCLEWNEDWSECIKHYEYCMDCSEIYVYRLSPCFDNMNDFMAWFYSSAEIAPDAMGKYPSLFEYYYEQPYLSETAQNCIDSYWHMVALQKYSLNYEVFVDYYAQEWQQWFWNSDNTYIDYVYTQCVTPDDYWCECAEYNDYGCASCPDGCNIHEFVERYIDHQNSEGPLVVKLDPKGEYAAEYYVAVGGYYGTSKNCYGGTMCYNPASCCDWRDKAASALETVTAPIIPAYGKKEEYIKYSGECFWSQPREASGTKTFSCTNSQNLCCDFSYSLSVIDYYYYSPSDVRILGNWPRITFRRLALTPPEALGVRAKVILRNTKNDLGQEPVTTQEEVLVDFLFDAVYEDLPLLQNVSVLSVLSTWKCNDNCTESQGNFTFEPYTSGAAAEKMEVKIIGLEYI